MAPIVRKQTKVRRGKVVNMLPRRGNAGSVVRDNFTKTERLRALVKFYKGYKNGAHLQDFISELSVATKKGWVQ